LIRWLNILLLSQLIDQLIKISAQWIKMELIFMVNTKGEDI